jgi:hypothetical protein
VRQQPRGANAGPDGRPRVNLRQRHALRNALVAGILTLVLGSVLVTALSGGGGTEVITSPTSSPSVPICVPTWERVTSPDPEDGGSLLFGVSAVAADDAWAVGGAGDPTDPTSTLAIRSNGSEWDVVPSPNAGTAANRFDAVDGLSGDAAWAVGASSNGVGDSPIAAQWEGATWTLMSLPADLVEGALTGVAAFATDDVWAVGYSGDREAGLERALAIHWDGTAWRRAPVVPAIGGGRSALLAVAGTSSGDVWAVGYRHNRPVIAHFDGRAWGPSFASDVPGTLAAIAAIAPDDVWAVGDAILRWDGKTWTEQGRVRGGGSLTGISPVGADDVWAVGSRTAGEEGTTKALVQRWDGTRWTLVRGSGGAGAALTAVSALPDGTVLAVGYRDVKSGRSTYALSGTTCPAG